MINSGCRSTLVLRMHFSLVCEYSYMCIIHLLISQFHVYINFIISTCSIIKKIMLCELVYFVFFFIDIYVYHKFCLSISNDYCCAPELFGKQVDTLYNALVSTSRFKLTIISKHRKYLELIVNLKSAGECVAR